MTAKRARDDSAKALGSAPAIKKRWALLQQSKPDFSQCRQRGSSLIAGADCARAAGVDTPAKSAGMPTEQTVSFTPSGLTLTRVSPTSTALSTLPAVSSQAKAEDVEQARVKMEMVGVGGSVRVRVGEALSVA